MNPFSTRAPYDVMARLYDLLTEIEGEADEPVAIRVHPGTLDYVEGHHCQQSRDGSPYLVCDRHLLALVTDCGVPLLAIQLLFDVPAEAAQPMFVRTA